MFDESKDAACRVSAITFANDVMRIAKDAAYRVYTEIVLLGKLGRIENQRKLNEFFLTVRRKLQPASCSKQGSILALNNRPECVFSSFHASVSGKRRIIS
jgi:hypothetical protein